MLKDETTRENRAKKTEKEESHFFCMAYGRGDEGREKRAVKKGRERCIDIDMERDESDEREPPPDESSEQREQRAAAEELGVVYWRKRVAN